MSTPTILVGCDPELFMKNANDGSFVSAHDRVPGTKYKPFKVEYGAVQIDGTALEFNIDPAASVDEFVRNIKAVRKSLEGFVPGYNVVAEPVALYDKKYFTHEIPGYAKTLGCDPDYNAWTLGQNPPPNAGKNPMRTGAGHIHIGWTDGADVFDKEHYILAARIARQCDYYLGIQSLLWDSDPTRRLLYGKAGAFRPKHYGVEYRTLSNRWLSSDALTAWVYNAALLATKDAFGGFWAEDSYGDSARGIIDTNNTEWFNDYQFDLGLEGLPVDTEELASVAV